MRSVDKGGHPIGQDGEAVRFADYQEAGPYLKERIGRYCSYCERFIAASLAVEHKLPKDEGQWPELRLAWSNFLLACANCNSTKLNKPQKPLQASDFPWPDVDDSFSLVSYKPSGRVEAVAGLADLHRMQVERLLDLVGLRKEPKDIGTSDHRFFDRLEVWGRAKASREDLLREPSEAMQRQIAKTAQATGGFSIWMMVFADRPDMQTAFTQAFPGTRWSVPPSDHGSRPA